MVEQYQAGENMKKFFEKLLNIKELVLNKYKSTGNEEFKEIYDQLDAIIKSI